MAAPNSPADDLLDHLVAAGVAIIGAESGWAAASNFAADSPDTHVIVYDTGGLDPSPKFLLDFPQIQVRVRGAKSGYAQAWIKIQTIKDILLGLSQTTIGGTLYVGVQQIGDINFISYDEPGRPILTANFQIFREPSDATNRTSMSV